MARIRIPSKAFPGFLALSNLESSQVAKISNYLDEAPVGTGPTKLNEHLSKVLNIPGAREIINTLVGMSELLSSEDFETQSLAQELSTSYFEQSEVLLTKEEIQDKKSSLQNALLSIFNSSANLRLTLKAIGLLAGDNYVFTDSQIVTDIRPVFKEDLEDKARNAVLVHYLHISYNKKGPRKMVLSLDLSDLKKLKLNIDRAIKKEELLTKDYEETFKFLNFNDEL